ncbi:MAG: hypothetical protein A2128_00255 [Candidatus Liptonbacteria bacterium GWC1_60_9]|uniref:Glutamyl-tRNA amidotransferase n=2 Tax=Candidatus Liptoniibacteriota TaxID=1817909 RepID=A0A1G2CNC5_9BACT|nr:MAG: hypothetical protein A2128_00255 [Candidatus Liptonbacteria bacterium GWC1_60_9]OGZ02875.1 MAG: hypothetical protein A3G64_01350 [Candidatus Liptonbacteria bacterium RIFCSPLOWO2_12_FULL_60_15]
MLLDKLHSELTAALKEKRAFEVGVLRLLTAAAHNRAIEKRGQGKGDQLTDEEVLEVLKKEAKKRKESIQLFTQGNRRDLAENEAKELALIERYLPAELSEKEVRAHVEKVFASGAVSAEQGFGVVMKEVMKELKGKADAGLVSKVVKEKIG